ncbi:capsule assembly Wzi family protein [Gillisia sp. M10.2A]|uniref:Capsule assembly Wzi family protein n=1 Tax=Gillisia lutea TaxID=2909668 RepID=A0ABS9EIN6_9FLAO|nr:capsule assembly Wzi family protein [Gillisia lutea]MCF4102686.1 capsule assembly Wzi family protein [Gillisia lutea]
MKYTLLSIIVLLSLSEINAQIHFSGIASAKGVLSSQEGLPFWMYTNQRGRLDESSNFSSWISANARYQLNENANLEVGLGALYHDGYNNEFRLDESYIGFDNSWLVASLGRKQREELYKGLSATNENILWSLNARPLAGISLATKNPLTLWREGGLAFTASIEEFIMDDDRYVEDTRLHHKSFHLIFSKIKNFEITVGMQHFAQWAGTSPIYGKLPGSFNDYMDVFTGNEGGDTVDGEEVNALGNQLGSYEVYINTTINNYNVQFIYNHLFEDGSGLVLRNTPDGRYGIFIESPEKDSWVNAFMYEFYYTKDQSDKNITTDGEDNYFNNNLYRSGWTYDSKVLGLPFITLNDNRFRVNNNKVVAHHVGITGIAFEKMPYKILTSYRQNYGAKGNAYRKNNVLSTYLDLGVWNGIIDINFQAGTDFSGISSPNFGAGIQVTKQLF